MHPSRIAGLLEPFLGPEDQRPNTHDLIQNISIYIDILQRWNARVNLTAIRTEEEIVTRHFGESVFAARHLFPQRSPVVSAFPLCSSVSSVVKGFDAAEVGSSAVKGFDVADVGSGAGFPGIPIKLWAPDISLTLIESNHKKATFLREVTRALTLTNVNIQTTRAESLAGALFDIVTLRAVEHFDAILPVAARLVIPAGRLALLISRDQLPRAQSSLPALTWSDPHSLPRSDSRILVIATTPSAPAQLTGGKCTPNHG
jgi:16S rRNA (guanine527-N7)-methyltransferase